MNELYNQTEVIRGRLYRYDPDRDVWYPVSTESEDPFGPWAWIIVLVLLTVFCFFTSK